MKTRYVLKLLIVTLAMMLLFTLSAFANTIGDVDGNGEVNAADARAALRSAVGLDKLDEDATSAADVDYDGQVGASDARLILRATVGLEELVDNRVTACEHDFKWVAEKNEKRITTGNHYQECTKCGFKTEASACSFGDLVCTTENTEPTCVKSAIYKKTCSVCGGVKVVPKPAKGHKWQVIATNKDTAAPGTEVFTKSQCTVCGETKTEYTVTADSIPLTIQYFNEHANLLKSETYKMSGFRQYTANTTVDTDNTGVSYSTTMKLLAKYMGEGFTEEDMLAGILENMEKDEAYNEFISRVPTTITVPTEKVTDSGTQTVSSNMYLRDKDIVSELTKDDIVACEKSQVEGLDFLKTMDSSVIVKTGSSSSMKYDLSQYETDAELLKITLTVKTETLAELSNTDAESSLQHIADIDLREISKYSLDEGDIGVESDDTMGAEMECTCKGAESSAKITYYFDITTNEPVAAVYDITYSVNELVNFAFRLNAEDLGLNLNFKDDLMTGKIDFTSVNHQVEYFFFTK